MKASLKRLYRANLTNTVVLEASQSEVLCWLRGSWKKHCIPRDTVGATAMTVIKLLKKMEFIA